MRVTPSTYIREHLEPNIFIEKNDIFSLYIIHGIENFNLKEAYRPVVSSKGSGRTGVDWSTLEEAVSEGKSLLTKTVEEWKIELEDLRKRYEVE